MSKTWIAVAGVALAILATRDTLPAQTASGTPKVYNACYVPASGTVYLIDVPTGSAPGAPSACGKRHVAFSWTDADGALNSASVAGGDVTGTFAALTVEKLLNRPLGATAPTTGQVLSYDGAVWAPTTPTAAPPPDLTTGGDLSGPLNNATVTKLQNRPVSSSAPMAGGVLMWNGGEWSGNYPVPVGGDLSGYVGQSTVIRLLNRPLSESAPQVGQALAWDGYAWVPSTAIETGGDLRGYVGSAVVAGLRNYPVSADVPGGGDILKFDGHAWKPVHPAPIEGQPTPVAPHSSNVAQVDCPSEADGPVGGGFRTDGYDNSVLLSAPVGRSWQIKVFNNSDVTVTIQAIAVCL